MDYRILVDPAAARRLRTFLPHVVQGLGRHLAELLEAFTSDGPGLAPAGDSRILAIDMDGVRVSCRIDGRDETLTILDVQERPNVIAPAGETVAAAPL
jgi:mRNA-degrading endonuclease RelE of RelBE toxin-antitoxin system